MAYPRERDDIIAVPRYDTCLDHDILVIEIQQRPHQPILIVNIQPANWERWGTLGQANE